MTRDAFRNLVAEREALSARLRPLEMRDYYERQALRALGLAKHPAAWVEIQINTGGDRAGLTFRVSEDPTAAALFAQFLERFTEALTQRWEQ